MEALQYSHTQWSPCSPGTKYRAKPQRVVAVVLFLIAFLTLAASRAFPFLDDIPGVVEAAVVVGGVACGFGGVYLWLRKSPGSRA